MMPGDRGPWLVFSVESATWPMIPPSLRFDRIEIESAGHVHRGSPLMSFGQILAFRTDSIPRRDPQLKMQLFPTQGNPVSMTVDNPFYRTEFPEWTPGPMPARATRGPFSVELTDIVIANEGGNYPVVNCTCTDPTLEPCHVFANLEDATGNRGPFVSPTESVWKVVAQLGVPVTATSPLNKRFPLGKIQIPPANTLVIWPKSVQDEDLVFQSQAIAGPGTYEMDHGKWKVVNAPKSGNSNGRVRGPAILCDYSRHNYLPGNSETILVQSRNGVRSASCSSYRSRMLSRSKLSTDVTAFSTLDLSEFSPGDEIELAIIRSRTEQFEFLVAPPDKSKSLPFPSYLPLPGD